MTPDEIEKHRKRFEEIIKSLRLVKYSLARNEDDEYIQPASFHMWTGYLLCAENMEVDISSHGTTSINTEYYEGYEESKLDLLDILRSQGIKVKE